MIRDQRRMCTINRIRNQVGLSRARVQKIICLLAESPGEAGIKAAVALPPRFVPAPPPRVDAPPNSFVFHHRAGIVSRLQDCARCFRAKDWAAMSDRDRRDFTRGVADAFARWPSIAKSMLIESIRRT